MNDAEKQTLIDGFRLLGEQGLEAREVLQAAIDDGTIDATTAGEACSQVEDLSVPE